MPNIRRYQETDLPVLRQFIARLHDALLPFDAYLPPSEQIIAPYFAYLLDSVRESSGTFLLAEDAAATVGFLCLFGSVAPSEPDQYPERYAVVSDLYVIPEYRGRGTGAALMRAAERFARELGAKKIELSVLAENRDAVDFYRRLNYAERVRVYTKKL